MSLGTAQPQPIGEGVLNTRRGSCVECFLDPVPLMYFRPETGEFIGVPISEVTAFENECARLDALVRDMHQANKALHDAASALETLARSPMPDPMAMDYRRQVLEQAERDQYRVNQALREALAPLSRLDPDAAPKSLAELPGTQLIELIPLAASRTSKQKGSLRGVKMTYVPSNKIKGHWRRYELNPGETASATKSFLKKDAQGKYKLDAAQLEAQLKKVAPQIKADFVDFDQHKVIGVLTEWAEAWNQQLKQERHLNNNITLASQAQVMRYLAGVGLSGNWEPLKGEVSLKASGRAEFAVAEAKAQATYHFPHYAGWMLFVEDAASKRYPLGAIRLQAELGLSGLAGASAVAELGLVVDVSKDNRAGIKGIPTPRQRTSREINVGQYTVAPGVAAELDVFAGAKADVALSGSVQWLHPEETNGSFKDFCKIGPGLGAQVGIGAGGMMEITYERGKFRIKVMASVCFGLGAKGKMELEVDAGQVAEFLKWFFYQLYHADFMRIKIVEERTLQAIAYLHFLTLDANSRVSDLLFETQDDIKQALKLLSQKLENADRRVALMQRILTNKAALRYTPPETKGMILYQLTRHSNADWADPRNHRWLSAFGQRKEAVKQVLLWAQTKRECDNIIQHMTATGTKGDFKANFDHLVRFFAMEAPKNVDLPLVNSSYDDAFLLWYRQLRERLKDGPTRGFAISQNDSGAYRIQMLAMRDHPKFKTMLA